MHNREITHIVKTDSLPKNQLVVRTKCSCCCHLRETYVKTKKRKNSFYETKMQKLDLRLWRFKFFNYLPLYWVYWGIHGLKSERSYVFFICFFI